MTRKLAVLAIVLSALVAALMNFVPSRPAVASSLGFTLDPLVQVSGPSPLGSCVETSFPDTETEPWIVVNPTNPDNIVGVWRQDIDWPTNANSFAGFVAGVSFDAGATWQSVVISGHIKCAGGSFQWGADPWLAFAPNGDLYFTSTTHDSKVDHGQIHDLRSAALVSKSTDGGLTWGPATTLAEYGRSRTGFPDKGSVTADPTNPAFAYAIWEERQAGGLLREVFARTTNGGLTWEPARVIYETAPGNTINQADQIVVLPDGRLVDLFTHIEFTSNQFSYFLTAHRSADRGATWATAIGRVEMFLSRTRDPDTANAVNGSGSIADVAVDPQNGNIYTVWNDARFNPDGFLAVAFSSSTDGGVTWSAPIKINKTPTDIAAANQQAFTPSIEVAADGTVGVTYYDFRFNDPSPGLPTDYWFIHADPASPGGLTDRANWTGELRVTDASFDMEQAPNVGGLGYFVGDYEGLASDGADFLAFFSQTHGTDLASVFFRRIRSQASIDAPQLAFGIGGQR